MRIKTYIIYFFALCVACEIGTDKNHIASSDQQFKEVQYYDDGNPKIIKHFSRDSIPDGLYKRFYKNGQLEIRITYNQGVRDGRLEEYYENGNLKTIENYKNGKLDGETKTFHENGIIRLIANYKEGRKRRGLTLFYSNGMPESYLFYGDKEDVLYRIDYNKVGDVIKEEGASFPEVFVESTEISKDDIFEVKIYHILPPHSDDPILRYNIIDNQNRIVKHDEEKSPDGYYIFQHKFIEKGEYTISLELILSENEKYKGKRNFDFKVNVAE